MLTFTATEAKQNFGKLTDTALTQPVRITRQGRVILEVMTPAQKEQLIQERMRQFIFEQFVQDAVAAQRHYEATGLHTTHEAMTAWLDTLKTNPEAKPPLCHR